MKQTPAGLMLTAPKDCSEIRDTQDGEQRYRDRVDAALERQRLRDRGETDLERQRLRDRGEADLDRQRIRDRLEATLAGLGELHYLRQRQEMLVRGILSVRFGANIPSIGEHHKTSGLSQDELYLSPEEKLLEENILLLRKQLNCLRRRDAGLITQLQELDKQISDLKLDVEKASFEQLETDSRPSSDDLHSLDYGEGQYEDQTSASVQRSFSSPHSNSSEMSADVHPKYQCDLISKNGSDVYRYPSPLHAVAVQSPMFFQTTMGSTKLEEKLHFSASDMSGSELNPAKPEFSSLPQSNSWPASQPSSNKKLDNYIFSLIQKKAQPIRTNKPRTNLNTDAAKGIFRQGSVCVRQTTGVLQGNTADLKPTRQVSLPCSETNTTDNNMPSPGKQWSNDSSNDPIENRLAEVTVGFSHGNSNGLQTNSLPKKITNMIVQVPSPCPVSVVYQSGSVQHSGTLPNENTHKQMETYEDINGVKTVQHVSPRKGQRSPHIVWSVEERPPLELRSEGSSSQSLDDGHLVNARYIPAEQQNIRVHRGIKHVKIVKVKSASQKNRMHISSIPEHSLQLGKDKTKVSTKKCHFSEDVDTNKKAVKKFSSRGKKVISPQLENMLPVRQTGLSKTVLKHNIHGREVFLAKPRHKRDYRRWKTIAEISYEEALRRARRRHRREMISACMQMPIHYRSPYAYIGSDSEYSAECESLFHSTVVDTSEDEQSNYTTNCFGDSESSLSEADFVVGSSTTSDSEENGGLVWPQFGQPLTVQSVGVPELHNASPKTFVKIKASHNLKKKILRFRSGSLKLMTTV
ncbi:dapper homolog 1 isoform X2 [Protopterus annectens]|uniref:dapper homolog 1 isoform X2 n=1 Tax=Protopterus annectens TaxID=7888 RepID=UPI001CFABCF8|nr:dapper homolog 1 isoform X2 [Protopterus annectens]